MSARVGVLCVGLIALAVPARAQQAPNGEAVFKQSCATCHREGQNDAPTRDALRQMTPESIYNALTLGRMVLQATALSDDERKAVSVLLAGRPFAPPSPPVVLNRCTSSPPMRDPSSAGGWNGWGNGLSNTRFQSAANGGLTAADLPKLKLKWAFGYSVVTSARAQPIVAGGRLFVASENMEIHALDPKTGCTHWTYKAQAGVRTALSAGPYKGASESGYAVYFGDSRANVYALDANSGKELWVRKVDDHRSAAITGAPTVYGGKVFVGVQGLSEEGQGGNAKYECCTFRGSVSALDANTGQVLWKTYTIEESKPRGKNKDGVQQWGPAGGGIWSAPTIDPKRNMVYVATGNNYADPSQPTTDAVLALDMNSGTRKWVNQITPNDNWTLGCGQSRQCELSREARTRLRLLSFTKPGHGQRPRPSRASTEVGDGVRARSGQRRSQGVGVPHRPGQRPRRTVGRRGGRAECVLRRVRFAVAKARRHSRREPRDRSTRLER